MRHPAHEELLDSTVRMLTADHGVQLGEHGRKTYGRTLFDEELHLPFEVRRHTTPVTGVLWRGTKLMHWPRTDTFAMFDLSRDTGER
ncbi:MAG: hypothetical protein PVI30_28180 [Myxococcales bacterium]